ncbi:MAG: NADH:ubiquinone reductase (Na(+)-transporting) subunit A [Rubrivivax sp.]|nr:NADH:ubiquinone reductase (Na(+)-transporting) subunit A [Rubrivivax sp.]
MQRTKIRYGLDVALPGAPVQSVRDAQSVRTVALMGDDFADIRFEFRVQPGELVRIGQILCTDRKRPGIALTSPAAGVIAAINRGHRRMLDSLVINVAEDLFVQFPRWASSQSRDATRLLLLQSGLWVALRTRPFGRVPNPDDMPAAIFVAAMDTHPLAADAAVVLAPELAAFHLGLDVLKRLTDGPVYVCQSPGPPLANSDAQLHTATFEGSHPAGLPGTHIHHLMPVSKRRTVWQIDCQDVVAMGHLAATGRVWVNRVVSLAGPGVLRPGLVRTRLGASLDELTHGELRPGGLKVISGSVLSGRRCPYLGRYHSQVTVLDQNTAPSRPTIRSRLFGLLPPGPAGAMVPLQAFEGVMSPRMLPTPLMRALSVGDIETAELLGCLELLEEDVALLSHLCAAKADYGALLRQTLDELAGDQP